MFAKKKPIYPRFWLGMGGSEMIVLLPVAYRDTGKSVRGWEGDW